MVNQLRSLYRWYQARSMLDKLLNVMLVMGLICLSAVVGYWIQDREYPATIKKVTVLTDPVEPGGVLKVRYTFGRSKLCHVRIEQVVYDTEGMRHTPRPTDLLVDPSAAMMPDETVGYAIDIPPHFVEGQALHRSIRAYYCNPLHELLHWPIILIGPDVVFEIRR